MTWVLKDYRLYVHEAPADWHPELLGQWVWNIRHNEGGWERTGQCESRELAFENMLDYLERLDSDQVSETYTVIHHDEQFVISMSPFEDIGTLAARVYFAANGKQEVSLDTLRMIYEGIDVDMHAHCGIVYGKDQLILEQRQEPDFPF